MVNNMDHGLPKFFLLGYDDWKILMEAHLYAIHDCMWMVLEDGPLKIQMENPERDPNNPNVVQYIPKPKEKWDDRDCKMHNLDNVAKAAIFKTLDPITFSKIKHLKTAMEIWKGLGKLCEGLGDLRKQKIEVLLEKFKSFKMLPRESFDLLDERFHKILNDLASLNHVLSPKEKNVRLLRSLLAEWYTKATTMEEGRNLENYIVQGVLDELRTYEHELEKKKKEEQITTYPTTLMTNPKVSAREGICPRSCDTPSTSLPTSLKAENYEDEFAMMVKQFQKFKNFFKKTDSIRRPSKGKLQISNSPPESYLCYNCRKPGHWKSAFLYPKVENIPTSENLFDKFKKMMRDFVEINLKDSSLTEENKLLSEENLKLAEGQKSQLSEITQLKTENESLSEKVKSLNKELGILMSKEAVDKLLETTKKKGREGLGFDPSSSKRKGRTTFIPPKPTAKPNKQKGKEMEKPIEVPKKEATKYPGVWYLDSGCSRHMMGDASLLSNLIPYDGPRVTFVGSNDFGLTKGLGNLVYKELTIQAVSYVEGLNYNLLSISQFCDKGYSLESWKDMTSLKNISTNEVILTGKRIRNIYEVMWEDVKEACLMSKGDTNLLWLWHKRLSHINFKTLNKLSKEGFVEEKMKVGGTNVHFKKLVAKCSSPAFYEAYLEMIKAQELSEFHHLEIPFKYEEEVLEFYRNEEIKTVQSKKNPQRSIQIIESTVGGTKVKISQKKMQKKLHLPHSGINSKRGCRPERIRVLHLGYLLESMGIASEEKKYEARYWLYYLSTKGENRASSVAEDEGSSENVLVISLKKSSKRKQVVSPSPSVEEPQDLGMVNLDEEEEVSAQEFEVDDEDTAVYKPIFSNPSENQIENQTEDITVEAQADMEADAEDFQIFLETSPAFETVPVETTELEISERSAENLEKSTPPNATEEEAQEEPEVEAQRSFEEAAEGAQIARLEATETPVAIFEQQNADVVRDSLSREISNYRGTETAEESVKTLKVHEEDVEEGEESESLPLQLYHSVPPSYQVTNFHFHSSSISTLPDEIPESWTRKVQGLVESALESQKASFREELDKIEVRHNKILEKTEEKYSSNLKEISQTANKTLKIISLMSNSLSTTMMTYASDCHLQLKEAMEVKHQIATFTTSLQKQMSLLQMDIRSALAVSLANQVVTQDYLRVLADNQKEAFKLFKHFATFTTKHKLDVTVQ
ncbi:unnamed protein product [Cuscuta campestris]|uniref:Uncharacterized protein n=1 Tax=Cuscuta campestris TaxID=132261 RepID=A0A484M572_9ASTE|nr:unnamed protein product [Cuscuta campestris]